MPVSEWKSPEGHSRVLVSEPVVRGVRQLAIDGFVALPRRGMEVGGLLVGAIVGEEVQVDGFEEMACEHRYGPSYTLSESDRASLSQLLAAWPGTKPPVVGFFRSFTSREPTIEAADEVFVQQHFPNGYFVYLMVQPLSVENCLASVRFFRDGRLLPASDDQPAPFAVNKNPPEPKIAVPSPAAIQNMPSAAPVIRPPHVRADDGEGAPVRRVGWLAAGLMCLISAGAGALIYQVTGVRRMPPVRESRWMDLHLDARPVDGKLEVSWDGAPRELVAKRGRLEVTQGNSRHEIELDSEQVKGGRLTYASSSGDDVRLRLSLDAKGSGIVEDAVRIRSISDPVVTLGAEPSDEPRPQVAVLPAEVHTVQPTIPAGIRARIAGPVVIPVEVQVSERGQVVRAVAERSPIADSVHRYLAEQAQQAAMKWKFKPARMTSGDRIAASKTVRFVFTR